jgi:Trk K+ transport system NAD-binding subunit
MWTALRSLGTRDVGRLPVVKRGAEQELVGVVRRKDIIQAYNTAIIQRARHQSRSDRLQLGRIIDSEFIELEIPPQASVLGKRVSEIQLPDDCLIVSIQRGRKLYIAHGYSTLDAGDVLTVISSESSVDEVRKILCG